MVFKPFTHLARQGFAKSFTHGYAQSVVAATQSSYASSSTPFGQFGTHAVGRFGKAGNAPLHSAFQNNSNQPPASRNNLSTSSSGDAGDGGLAAYYDAWQRHGNEERGWQQFQFTKRIGWKEPQSLDIKLKGKEDLNLLSDASHDRTPLDRAYSTSAVDNIKEAEDVALEAVAIAQIDDVIANEIRGNDAQEAERTSPLSNDAIAYTVFSKASSETNEANILSSPPSEVTAPSSPHHVNSEAVSEHISKLSDTHQYEEIPHVFQSMLVDGLRPTVPAYNALLAAVIHLPLAKHQVVPKALDVYSDMLKRKIVPDTAFYATLLQLLSRRAIDVFYMKSSLEKRRIRYGARGETGNFMFRSNEAEYDILIEDSALKHAINLFRSSILSEKSRSYSSETYLLLATACAVQDKVEDMIRIYSHMESNKVLPFAAMFPPMIEAFGKSGDLNSAVECYNEYKALAISDDSGKEVIIGRNDNNVYATLVKVYAICGKTDGGNRFIGKIVDSYNGATTDRKERLQAVHDTIIIDALIQERLDSGDFLGALELAEERDLTDPVRMQSMIRICATAADHGEVDVAARAYQKLSLSDISTSPADLSMLAFYLRQGDISQARTYWERLNALPRLLSGFVEPTVRYSVALIEHGQIHEGLMQARISFSRIRASITTEAQLDTTEEIDEGIAYIGAVLAQRGIVPSPHASMSFLRAMIENKGLVSPVAEQLLAGLGPEGITELSLQDLVLAVQVEAGLLCEEKFLQDVAHMTRFTYLLEAVIGSGVALDLRTTDLIEKIIPNLTGQRPDLVQRWHNPRQQGEKPLAPAANLENPKAIIPIPALYPSSYDPYAKTTDIKGSNIIADELDNGRSRSGANLNEALMRFRNIRRAGRHPRYIVYAKLIAAAAKEGRTNLVHDIHGMARQDIPLLPQYTVVRHGWASILDAMLGACLTVGNRNMAAQFHQELLEMGSAPTANTFGLYITTLKDSARTFDEATEAVKIFHRAKSEGVEPSSFLYNALIGKLGKARRIDDCLFYFAEMRSLGIRPTSVTYGTIVNALCRVSDERFAEELFEEMESMPNYKPRPAPYNSLMQFFLTTKRDSSKVLSYYERMRLMKIEPTMHTYKLLIDTYATLEPIDMRAAVGVFDTIRASGQHPEAVHYASLIHAKGCALHDMQGARQILDEVLAKGKVRPQACLYQALFESMVANHRVKDTEELLSDMSTRGVQVTPYITNTLIHGWANENDLTKAKAAYDIIGKDIREPSTYEAMTRAFLTAEDRSNASEVVHEMLSRGYPSAVSGKIVELLGHGMGLGGINGSTAVA